MPQSKKEAIGDLQCRAQNYRDEEKRLESEKNSAAQDLKSIRSQLIGLATSVQDNESLLQSLGLRIAELDTEKSALNETLQEDRLAISRLVLALERLRRLPPQAMIASPDAPITTARSAMLMQDILPTLNTKTKDLREKLSQLDSLEADLKAQQNRAHVTAKKLEAEQKDLEALLSARENLYARLDRDIQDKQNKAKSISRQAKNLSDLVTRLEDERTRNQREEAKKRQAVLTRNTALPSVGKTQLPLSGIIRTNYNEEDSFGAKSKGISIEGHSGALIIAPMGGVVRFAGYFKHYGNMVILEHKNGYHSLIAGLEKIDTVVDQSLLAGEPIGRLYTASNNKPPTLYFELRHRGKAINPAKKFKLAKLG